MRKEEKEEKKPVYQITISISEENASEPFMILKERGENLSDIALFTEREKVVCKAVAEHFKAESPFEMDFLVELNGEYYDSDEYHMLYKKDSGKDKIINLELESLESIKKTIKEAIKEYCDNCPAAGGFFVPTDEEGYFNINVNFINSDKDEDQTQFDILPADFCHITGKCKDLEDLWRTFCIENGFRQNSVTSIAIVGGW